MKNITRPYLLTAIILVSVAACKKKQEDPPQAKLYGSWQLVSYALDDNNNNVIDAAEIESYPNADTSILTFKSDGTGSSNTNGSVGYLTWSLTDKNELIIKSNTSSSNDTMLVEALLDTDLTLRDNYFNSIAKSIIWYSYKKL